jgi:hypothetical protein
MMSPTMHCPHAVPNCPTCENSEAAKELRALRKVFDEIGVAIAGVETDALANGLHIQALGARECLRAVASIRDRVLRTTQAKDADHG